MVSFGREPKETNTMAVRKPKGRNYYMVDLYEKTGRRIRKKIGGSKKLAETIEADLKVKIAKEEFLGIVDPKKIRFKEFATEFLEWAEVNRARATTKKYKSVIRKWLLPLWGKMYLQQITTKMIEDFKTSRATQVKPASVNKDLTVVMAMLSRAVDWGYLKESPAKRKVKTLKTPNDSYRFLSEEEADLLLEFCKDSECTALYVMVLTAIHTGMRSGEIFNLHWQDINFKSGVIEVVSREGHLTKTNKSRSIPMSSFLASVLRKHPRRIDSPYVFPGQGGRRRGDINRVLHSAREAAGVAHFTVHDLRHTFASWAVMNGVHLVTLSKLLGHSDIKQTMRYAHLAPDYLKGSVSFLDGHNLGTSPNMQQHGAV
jgi:integrase